MLHTEQKHASALGPLQQELQQQHPQMHEAFVQYWPVVTALYEEREAPQQGKDLWVQAILQRQQPGVEIDLHGLVNPTP